MAIGSDQKGEIAPFLAMAAVEFINVGLNTLFKAASEKGMSNFVLITYANAIGALTLLPFIFVFPSCQIIHSWRLFVRKQNRASFACQHINPQQIRSSRTSRIIEVFGNEGSCAASVCSYVGIEYTSPTICSAISNLIPALTFVFAVAFRMEALEWRSWKTRAKIVGTLVSISGAIITILYKGHVILSPPSQPLLLELALSPEPSPINWVIGGLLLVGLCLFASLSFIIQTQIVKLYPNELTVAVIASLLTSIVAAIVGAVIEKNTSAWALKTDMAMLTVVLTGMFGPALATAVHTWGLSMKGPVYVTIFKPFSIAIAAAMGVVFLRDALYLGSVIGATIILVGFYAVIWGKREEPNEVWASDGVLAISSDNKTPLLL